MISEHVSCVITITEHMRDVPRAKVQLLLHGEDGQPHRVSAEQADHVPQAGQHTEHIPATATLHCHCIQVKLDSRRILSEIFGDFKRRSLQFKCPVPAQLLGLKTSLMYDFLTR